MPSLCVRDVNPEGILAHDLDLRIPCYPGTPRPLIQFKESTNDDSSLSATPGQAPTQPDQIQVHALLSVNGPASPFLGLMHPHFMSFPMPGQDRAGAAGTAAGSQGFAPLLKRLHHFLR